MIPHDRQLARQELELQAHQHLADTMHSWMQFTRIVLEIKSVGYWQDVSDTWANYCRDTYGIDASRIRQYANALPYAERLSSVLPDVDLPEGRIRALRKVVNADNPNLASIYQIGASVKSQIGASVSDESVYRHVAEVLDESYQTGFVDVGTGQIPSSLETIQLAVLASIGEAQKRQAQQIRDSAEKPALITGIIYQRDGYYELSSNDEIPHGAKVKIYLIKERD